MYGRRDDLLTELLYYLNCVFILLEKELLNETEKWQSKKCNFHFQSNNYCIIFGFVKQICIYIYQSLGI